MHPHAAPTRHAGIPGRAEASVVEIDEPEIEVELQLEAVVQLDLVVAAVALEARDAAPREMLLHIGADRLRHDAGRNLAVFAVDLLPCAPAVELDLEPVTNTTLYSLSKSSVSTLAKEISTPGKCSERNRCEAAGSSASVRGRLFSQAVVRPAASNAISGRIGNFLIRFFRFKAECFFSVQK